MCMVVANILNMNEGYRRRKNNMILIEMVNVVEPPDHHCTRVSLSQLTKSSWASFTLQEEYYNSQSENIKAIALIFEDKKSSSRRVIVRELH